MTRERILAEATRLFEANGYKGISMREIAAACHISKPGLYYHFKDKEDLFLAILRENLNQLEQVVRAAAQSTTNTREIVLAVAAAIFTLPAEYRAVIRLASQEMSHLGEGARRDFGLLYREKFLRPLEVILAEGVQRGVLREVDPGQALWLLLGMMYPFLSSSGDRRLMGVEETAALITQTFFDGMGVRP